MEEGFAQPSRRLSSPPPSYEEAVANAGGVPNPSINAPPPYPVGACPMPMPVPAPYNQPPNQRTVSIPRPTPVSPSYSRSNVHPAQPTYTPNADQNLSQAPEVRNIHQHVTCTLGSNPVKMTCPFCHAHIKTTTVWDHQPSAHICCILLCILGCCLCAFVPYCMRAFMTVHHFCPNCKNYIGSRKDSRPST